MQERVSARACRLIQSGAELELLLDGGELNTDSLRE